MTLNLMEIEQPLGDAEAVILCSATVLCFSVKPPQSGNDEGMLPMTCRDPLAAECPLDLTEDDCRTLIRLLRYTIIPDRERLVPQIERLRMILEKLEFAVGG